MTHIEIIKRKVQYKSQTEWTNDIAVNGKVVCRAVSDKMAPKIVEKFGETWGKNY